MIIRMNLTPVVRVIDDKCVNCHQCIAVCPVKICQDGSGKTVTINHELCIGCGSCISACTHEARKGVDDWELFLSGRRGTKVIAIVAPSAAASFEGNLLRLNGFLKSLGVEAFFDVSFGAELTVHSYLKHIKKNSPPLVIAQPCPAVVNYLEIFQPELLAHLAPADSPMLHTMKMIRTWHPEFEHHKIAVISPCLAKKREFEATGLGDYNLTFQSIEDYLSLKGISLKAFPEIDYLNPAAERAAQFSTPGGLMATIQREAPQVVSRIKKIEGPTVYDYFKSLPESLKRGRAPLIVDCLNCEKGCNGGTGTSGQHLPSDLLDGAVSERVSVLKLRYSRQGSDRQARKRMGRVLEKFWKPHLYDRAYVNRSGANNIHTPAAEQLETIYRKMLKIEPRDFLNCAACGYQSCEKMAQAIHNGLNRPENCHHYQTSMIEHARVRSASVSDRLQARIDLARPLMERLGEIMEIDQKTVTKQSQFVVESSSAI